eukprot:1711598-Prymnesium_polylepis.1
MKGDGLGKNEGHHANQRGGLGPGLVDDLVGLSTPFCPIQKTSAYISTLVSRRVARPAHSRRRCRTRRRTAAAL